MTASSDAVTLTKSAILDAALRLADEHGIEAVTMRRIAGVLGVSSMAAYRHIRTKDEIVEGLGAIAWEVMDTDLDPDLPWDEQLRRFFRHMHRMLLEHPGLVEILLSRPVKGITVYRTMEHLVGVMREAGFSLEEAMQAIASLESFTFGFTVQQRTRAGRDPSTDHAQLHELPADEFPNLRGAARRFASWASEDRFTNGLEWCIGNLRRDLEGTAG